MLLVKEKPLGVYRARGAHTNGLRIETVFPLSHDPDAKAEHEVKRHGAVGKLECGLHAGCHEK